MILSAGTPSRAAKSIHFGAGALNVGSTLFPSSSICLHRSSTLDTDALVSA